MQKRTFVAVLFAGVILGFGSAEMIHAQMPGYVTKQVFKTDLANLPGQEAIIYASEWPPGFRLPLHKHEEGHEFVYVVEGEQTFEIEGCWHEGREGWRGCLHTARHQSFRKECYRQNIEDNCHPDQSQR